MPWLGLDVGGANLKLADGQGFACSVEFPLWRNPAGLVDAVSELLAHAPGANRLAVTMTGELADCYRTKSAGVRHIVESVQLAGGDRRLSIYLVGGDLVSPAVAVERSQAAAASNWHAAASFAARYVAGEAGLLIDIGSTTSDLIPIAQGRPSALGLHDPGRLVSGELVYTGVERSPICALCPTLPWRGESCPTAQEVFATSGDAYLVLGQLPEQPDSTHTADGRPATQTHATERLARSICADGQWFDADDAREAAMAVRARQLELLTAAVQQVLGRQTSPPSTIVLSGAGEFLGRQLVERLGFNGSVVSLTEKLGPQASRCAPAHALAVLASENALD